MREDKVRDYNEQQCDPAKLSTPLTLRQKLEREIENGKTAIKFSELRIQRAEQSLALLNKNKDLETLLTLFQM